MANGAIVKSRYSSTLGRAALAPTLKKMESASATVTKMSPLTPIAWASASFEKGDAVLSIVVRTSVAPGYRPMRGS